MPQLRSHVGQLRVELVVLLVLRFVQVRVRRHERMLLSQYNPVQKSIAYIRIALSMGG